MPQALLNQAISELSNLQSGEEFLVKELFKGYEWKRFTKGDRLTLGTLFLNYVKSTPTIGIDILEKTSANQQKYRKQ